MSVSRANSELEPSPLADAGDSRRERIVAAASELLGERGYASISTLDIANRAKVSKRELYRFFDDKLEIIHACVARRAAQLRIPVTEVEPSTRSAFITSLEDIGSAILQELSDPTVVALYRLAVSEADASPEIAAALDSIGRDVIRDALIDLFARGQAIEAIGPSDPSRMASELFGLLWGDLQVRLILGVAGRPTSRECTRRARTAVNALLRLNPPG
jgi:AcrR family transcriptional regulator